ncbi:hypothetical protein [Lysobacter sp. F6437]|uniref:hypothetical protein n=1 Tax=Lysobacter sp. F6437 TaxID=3459296 RepID=UPI00403DE555
MSNEPRWVIRGKSVRQLIEELQTFEDQDAEVRISLDCGATSKCISLVGMFDGKPALVNCEGQG